MRRDSGGSGSPGWGCGRYRRGPARGTAEDRSDPRGAPGQVSSSQIVQTLSGDLVDEHADLDRLLGAVPDCAWKLPTPAVGWDISASLSHLCFFDSSATLAAADPESFEVHRRLLHDEVANGRRPDVDLGLRLDRPALLLEQWREGLHRFIDTIEQVPSDRTCAVVRADHEPGQYGERETDGNLGARCRHPRRSLGPDVTVNSASPHLPHRLRGPARTRLPLTA